MIKINCLIPVFLFVMLSGCGGGSSGSAHDDLQELPVNVSETAVLTAATPSTFTYELPAPTEPFTEVTIDLERTLEAARIRVTQTP